MKWFKFYGADYLSDQKMLALSATARSCWVTLLCYACNAESNGQIRYVTEERLMIQSGLNPTDECWDRTVGVLKKFEELNMIKISDGTITILNWGKRQESYLTGAERQKRYRDKKKSDAKVTQMSPKGNARLDKTRIDKINTTASVTLAGVFNFDNELEKLRTDKKKHIKIIALYWKKKKWVFENKEQFDKALKREMKAATALTGYTGEQIARAIKHCEENYKEWSLETVGKRITDVVNKKI